MLLEFTETCYEEKQYTCGEGNAFRVCDPVSSAKPPALELSLWSYAQRVASRLSWVGHLSQLPGSPLLCPAWGEVDASFIKLRILPLPLSNPVYLIGPESKWLTLGSWECEVLR